MAQPTRGRNSQAKNHLITIVLALIIAVLATWFGYGRDHAAADPSATAAPGVTATAMPGDGLTVTYLDVGQGDCTLLQCDGQVMLIDAAEGNQANKITAYLKQHGVTAIDYLVCTHAHADHCGGMKAVIAAFPVRTLYSSVTSSSNGAFQRVMRAAETANLAITVPNEIFPLVRTLKKIGVRFAPASGRQYYNLYEQFGEIADELMYISENGGMVCDGREIVSFEAMPQQLVCAAVELARGLPNVHAIASMRDGAAYEDDDPVFVENMAMYYARRKKVPDLLEAVQQEPVCKVALFCKNAAETNVLPYYRQMFDDKLQVALSGADWVDFARRALFDATPPAMANLSTLYSSTAWMRLGLSKGVAVGVMCDNLHITPAQCMAFGDYLNDVELLRSVGESYAMANAHERLKKVAKMFVRPMMRTACAARSAAYWRWNKSETRESKDSRVSFELGCICILFGDLNINKRE